MQYVINVCFGGFSVPDEVCQAIGCDPYDDFDSIRTNPTLIDWVKKNPNNHHRGATLEVVNIPDEATDWELDEYDGSESITYVVNGKIHHLDHGEGGDDEDEDEDEYDIWGEEEE